LPNPPPYRVPGVQSAVSPVYPWSFVMVAYFTLC
jgi:hypothetical protein